MIRTKQNKRLISYHKELSRLEASLAGGVPSDNDGCIGTETGVQRRARAVDQYLGRGITADSFRLCSDCTDKNLSAYLNLIHPVKLGPQIPKLSQTDFLTVGKSYKFYLIEIVTNKFNL